MFTSSLTLTKLHSIPELLTIFIAGCMNINNISIPDFLTKYNLDKLVYCESYESIDEAITREKQLKSWKRQWKLDLIKSQNPMLEDISKKFDDMDW